jgi:hypothetical protein
MWVYCYIITLFYIKDKLFLLFYSNGATFLHGTWAKVRKNSMLVIYFYILLQKTLQSRKKIVTLHLDIGCLL